MQRSLRLASFVNIMYDSPDNPDLIDGHQIVFNIASISGRNVSFSNILLSLSSK